ncbi:hypothetical protein C0Z10_08710 [Acidipropionibacterium jensenii]|uniref:50S ribosomal protein L4 n=1 Tax=Acidipropionibacterium jensenii TaxID=1749 RepID=A0A3T0S0G3_9ACTN|nr:hypothetical protein [Acidipropionibacterium jensenii]AZZ39818.1 hypothetical protein C0Z10_08710 [Acidipropionibacterium jensenii]
MSCTKKSLREAAEHTAASAKEQSAQALAGATTTLRAAQEKAAPLAAQAADRIGPLTEQAAERGRRAVAEAREVTQQKVVPAVKQAYESFQKDVLPELEVRAREVASSPAVEEATRRGQAALSALKGQTAGAGATAAGVVAASPKLSRKARKAAKKAEKKLAKADRKSHKVLKTFLILGGLGAAGIIAARKFLGSSDDGWTAREPAETYSWTPKAPTTEPAPAPEAEKPAPQASAPSPESPGETSGEATMTEEGAPVPEGVETTADAPADDSYVGNEPPEGYVIKANSRSKKYHLPGSAGYDRTITDIWFASEEAAEAAGFTKAQR